MKFFFHIAAGLLTVVVQAQQSKVVKLYAFVQQVVPGAQKARDIDENGNRTPAEATENGYRYLLYASSSSATRLYPVELWLKGEKYGVKMKTIEETPVTVPEGQMSGRAKNVVLVPKTSQKVWQLIPTDAFEDKKYPTAEKLSQQNEVVFVLRQGGKFYYQTLPKLAKLEAVNMQ